MSLVYIELIINYCFLDIILELIYLGCCYNNLRIRKTCYLIKNSLAWLLSCLEIPLDVASRVCPWCWMTRTVTSDGAEDKDRDPGQGQPAPAREDTRSGRSSL